MNDINSYNKNCGIGRRKCFAFSMLQPSIEMWDWA